ncbi:Sucrose synthase 7, partial [Cucurbita argyrosperma subsp. sororia]
MGSIVNNGAAKRPELIAHGMPEALKLNHNSMKRCFGKLVEKGNRSLKLKQLMEEMEHVEGVLGHIFASTQEAIVTPPYVAFAVRPEPGRWEFVRVSAVDLSVKSLTSTEFLKLKEIIYDKEWANDEHALEVDFGAIEFTTPHLTIPSSIGEASKLQTTLILADIFLSTLPPDTPYENFHLRLKEWGFEKGWGDCAGRVKETMRCLSDILQAYDPTQMAKFFSWLPTIFNIVILSPHGYFGQADVLGLPDTGGQVVYILDQVKAMEEELLLRIKQQGLNFKPQIIIITRLIPDAKGTKCNQEIEPVLGTNYSKIVRVPFRTEKGVLRRWVSRFDIYPFLERFAQDATAKILDLMGAKPDLIIGNYTDGNLVASLMASKLGITQATIAHALEKTKYEDSDLKWKELDSNITFHIAGSKEKPGQYESHEAFTLPGLCTDRVSGINVFDPSSTLQHQGRINRKIENDEHIGYLADKKKPIVFYDGTVRCREEHHGLVEWFGKNEKAEKFGESCCGHIRWIAAQTDRRRNGELYRCIADTKGAFVQPALYEAFGLTVIEAMNSGLPTFATNQGGPAEIIVDGISGFHIDPNNGAESSKKIANFFENCKNDHAYWTKISNGGLKRIDECYTWKIYANKVLNMGSTYTFWNQLNNHQKQAKQRYIQMFYNLLYKNLVKTVPVAVDDTA